MRYLLICLFCFSFGLISPINSQVVYSHKIDSLINLVSIQQLIKTNKEITGDTVANIGGVPRRILTRYALTQGNKLAAQYIRERFSAYGLAARYQMLDTNIVNVIGWKTGTRYPNQYFLIGAHYDNILYGASLDTVYGADDNGTGLCVMLELARILQGFNTDYSIAFVAFNEEELSGVGSWFYADSAYLNGDSLKGVLNAEMLGYDGNGDNKVTVITNANSDILSNLFISSISKYQINLLPVKQGPGMGADHTAFWYRGFKAITTSEYIGELTPHYHSRGDRWFNLTQPMFEKMTKANIATFLSWVTGNYCEIKHTPLTSSFDSNARTVTAEISMLSIATGTNAPRLYYKLNDGQYSWANAFEINGRNYKFSIPGQLPGSKISYYIAAQDSSGNVTSTAPFGGGGVNPPGNIPPQNLYVYYILLSNTYGSVTVPKTIPSILYDTIHVGQSGNIRDMRLNININHPNTSNIRILLKKKQNLNVYSSTLIEWNVCNGANFTNTNFTDTASLKINQGVAPYTGYFAGVDTLSKFKDINTLGDWILIVNNKNSAVTGTLTGWNITFAYENTVSVTKESEAVPDKYCLFQNYPNPFNPVTKINYALPKQGFVTLKIFDINGREIQTLVDELLQAGYYSVDFNGSSLASGVYFYRFQSGDFVKTKRMVLIK